jgi:hypothetical protein
VVISITLLIPRWYWYEGIEHCKYDSSSNHCECENNERPVPCFAVNLIPEPKTAHKESNSNSEPKVSHWWDPQWLIVYVTLMYAGFAGLQWWAIRNQAKISRENITILERPWILVKMRGFVSPTINVEYIVKLPEPGSTEIEIEYSVVNFGKSVAWVTAHWADAKRFDGIEDFLKTPPPYLSKGASIFTESESMFTPGESRWVRIKIPAFHFLALAQRAMFLYVYGIITYRDLWDGTHKTRFSFLFHVPTEWDQNPEGFYAEPAEYNEQT